jgi:flagellin-like hook-associated protein FlgL
MSQVGNIAGRSTSLAISDALLSSLRRTQTGLTKAQEEISTGKAVEKPSDAPSKIAAILLLQGSLARRVQQGNNLQNAGATLDTTDQSLGDATDLLLEAKSVASSQVGIGSNSDTRKNQATVIDAQLQSLLDIANRTYQGVSLFGGSVQDDQSSPFASFLGGVRYVGAKTNLAADVGLDQPLEFNSNGQEAFGALSGKVSGTVTLSPGATNATRIGDVLGAQGQGVRLGTIKLNVDSASTTVDLSTAQTLGDVVTRINAAIDSLSPGAGSLNAAGTGLSLTAGVGHSVTIGDVGAGQTAGDLGIRASATASTVAGVALSPRLTEKTPLSALGSSIDWTSGIQVTQGAQTKTVTINPSGTVQDLANAFEALGLGVSLKVNDQGNGFDVTSQVSGLKLSIGENGGTTAGDLGIRTFGLGTELSGFNGGLGVSNVQGSADFKVTLHSGASFSVDIDGVTKVSELITRIQDAATTAGLTVGAPGSGATQFNVGLATTGNGLVFEDKTAGGSDFRVTQVGTSLSATDLGIYKNAGSGSTIAGDDVAQVQPESLFTHLMALRDALRNDDSRGITLAGSKIETDIENLARARADVGVRSQRVESQKKRADDLKIADESTLSLLRDTDMAEAITRFSQLQQQLQASLQVGSKTFQRSLLDYLG